MGEGTAPATLLKSKQPPTPSLLKNTLYFSAHYSPLSLWAGRAGRGARGEGWMPKHEDAQPELHENPGPLPTRAALTLSPGGRGNCPCGIA